MHKKNVAVTPGQPYPHPRPTSSVRFAPGRDGRLLCDAWRIWAQGDEVYASTRGGERLTKVSLHRDRWFVTTATHRKDLARPLPMLGDQWLHALEIQFLCAEGSMPPVRKLEFKQSKPLIVIDVPPGCVLVVNILYGNEGVTRATPLPPELSGAVRLLQLKLRNGTAVEVLSRVVAMQEQHLRKIQEHREQRRIRVTMAEPINTMYAESMEIQGSAVAGNAIVVVPLGPETFTWPGR